MNDDAAVLNVNANISRVILIVEGVGMSGIIFSEIAGATLPFFLGMGSFSEAFRVLPGDLLLPISFLLNRLLRNDECQWWL